MKASFLCVATVIFWTVVAGPNCHADVISECNRIGDNYLLQNAPKQEERGLAMMRLAQFEVVNAVVGGYTPYAVALATPGASPEAAAARRLIPCSRISDAQASPR